MATFKVADGAVYSGSYAVAEITGYNYGDSVTLVEDSNAFDTQESYKVGKKKGDGGIRCHYDPTDTNGQNTLRSGETVTLHIYPRGTTPGLKEFIGSVKIETFKTTGEDEGLVEAEFTFKGILTEEVITE